MLKETFDISTQSKQNMDILKDTIFNIENTTSGVENAINNITNQMSQFETISEENQNGINDIVEKAQITQTMANKLTLLINQNHENSVAITEIVEKFQQ